MADDNIRPLTKHVKDITGDKFGKWTVLHYDIASVGKRARWICKCDCGTVTSLSGHHLRTSAYPNCGCDRSRQQKAVTTHGLTGSTEYRIWRSIKSRCTREKHVAFDRYHGRGIYLCDGWSISFAQFLEDMGRIADGCVSIDRIDNDGPYTCGHCKDCTAKGATANCRWATAQQQARNRRNNHYLTHAGVTKLLIEWAEDTGIRPGTLSERLRRGWTVAHTLTTPLRQTPIASPR